MDYLEIVAVKFRFYEEATQFWSYLPLRVDIINYESQIYEEDN